MSQQQARDGLSLKYVTEFSCIGDKCPDSCCHGWQVILDRKSYKKMEARIPADELRDVVKLTESGDKYDYARITMSDDGSCPLLVDNGWCRLHRDYGEEVLSITCRTYPRQVSVMGQRTEMGLMLSCPEAARLCLLDPQGTALTKFDASDIIKRDFGVAFMQGEVPDKPYHHYIDVVRDAVLNLLAVREFPFASRVFIAGFFLEQISAFIHEDIKSLEDDRLVAVFENISAEGVMEGLYKEFLEIDDSLDFSMSVIENLMLARAARSSTGARLLQRALSSYGITAELTADGMEMKVQEGSLKDAFVAMAESYRQRRDTLTEKFGEKINQYLENYGRNYWFREIFVRSPTPVAHMQVMVLRLAVLRFLFFSHENVTTLLSDDLSQQDALELLDQTIVDTVYRFSKAIEHDEEFLPGIQAQLVEQGMDSFAHSVLLMKF